MSAKGVIEIDVVSNTQFKLSVTNMEEQGTVDILLDRNAVEELQDILTDMQSNSIPSAVLEVGSKGETI